jgi:hypothetical protein
LSFRFLSKSWKTKIHTTTILSVALYGCKTSLTLREEHSLMVLENRVLRRIFGPKGEEVVGSCRRLRNGELHNLCASPNIIRVLNQGGWYG